jgi:hypothetical protein
MMVIASMTLRPTRSPKWPKIAAPSGRAKKPTPYVPNAAMVAAVVFPDAKNILLNTSAVAAP